MRIASSQIYLSARHGLSQKYEEEETLRIQAGNGATSSPGEQLNKIPRQLNPSPDNKHVSPTDCDECPYSGKDLINIKVAEILLEKATGKKVKLRLMSMNGGSLEASSAPPALSNGPSWGMEYNRTETFRENERFAFRAKGVVETADGKRIDISVNLKMSRNFMESHNINIKAGEVKTVDPLVINFNGGSADLTSTKFDFDLDSDGNVDKISFVGSNSGFLALDENNNGKIDNGTELFGPSTGNGFAELAQYDEDGNNWIDEGDSIYDKLHIWTKNSDGKDVLYALPEKDVGAIYLGNVQSGFNYKNEENQLLGAMKSAGIYLKESGTAGIVQQVDLAV